MKPCDTCQAYVGESDPPSCELDHPTNGPCDGCADHVSWDELKKRRATDGHATE